MSAFIWRKKGLSVIDAVGSSFTASAGEHECMVADLCWSRFSSAASTSRENKMLLGQNAIEVADAIPEGCAVRQQAATTRSSPDS